MARYKNKNLCTVKVLKLYFCGGTKILLTKMVEHRNIHVTAENLF